MSKHNRARLRTSLKPVDIEPPATLQGWRVTALAAGVCLVVAAVHWPVLSARAISLDDDRYLFSNPVLMQPSGSRVLHMFAEVLESPTIEGYYEPLTLASLAIDVVAGASSENLFPFHRTNLLLHLVATLLVFTLIQMLFAEAWVAAGVALLFGLHPLSVEPVAWVWERKTLLATALALASIAAYVHHTRGRRHAWNALSLLLFALALLAKPTVTPLPLLLLLLDLWPLKRTGRPAVWEKLPFFGLAAASAVVTVVSTSRNASLTVPGEKLSLPPLALRACYLLVFYLGKMIWPSHLSSVYLLPEPISLATAAYVGAVVSVVLIAVFIVLFRGRAPALLVGVMFFLIAILPTLGIIRYSWISASDKYVYFPSLGILLIIAWSLQRLAGGSSERHAGTRRVLLAGVIVVLAGAEAIGTRGYLARWRDTQTLYMYMLTLTPGVPMLHTHLGSWLSQHGRQAEAVEHFQAALQIDANSQEGHYNLGLEFLAQNQLGPAVEHLRRAIDVRPSDCEARNNLGIALAKQGDVKAAAEEFRRALAIRPHFVRARTNLGQALVEMNRLEEAVQEYRAAIRDDVGNALPHKNLAVALVKLNRLDEAIDEYRAATALDPQDAGTHCDLADMLATRGRWQEAVGTYRRALELDPSHARARRHLTEVESRLATRSVP